MEKKKKCKSLVVEGTKYYTHYSEKFKSRKNWERPDPNKILAVIPGTIVKIYVKEGQKVKTGDRILLLEAMKMKNSVKIDRPAIIKTVAVKAGQIVAKNQLLIELE